MEEENTKMFGKWKSVRVDNYSAYLAALGVNFFERKIAERTTTYLTISKEGNEWVWRLQVLVFDEVSRFIPGQEFDDVIEPGKKKCKSKVTFKDGRLIWVMYVDPPMTSEYYMEGDDTLISIDNVGDIVMKATYTRIK